MKPQWIVDALHASNKDCVSMDHNKKLTVKYVRCVNNFFTLLSTRKFFKYLGVEYA